MTVNILVDGVDDLVYIADQNILVPPGDVASSVLLVRLQKAQIKDANTPINIHIQDSENPSIKSTYTSMFIAPKPR